MKNPNKTHFDYMTYYFGPAEPITPVVKVFNSLRARYSIKVFNGVEELEKWLTENGREILQTKHDFFNVFEVSLA